MPLVSIIIPTYNSGKNLEILLQGLLDSENKNFEVIINDDLRTNDNTEKVIQDFSSIIKITYIKENQKMAQARKQGSKYAEGNILFHMDSDMKTTSGLIGEIINMIQEFDALIINEESFGTTFWAKCKWLEKRCYRGVREIESLRVIKKEIYEKIGGHDETMIFSEDKDFDLRVQEQGYKIGRAEKGFLWHNEGDLHLFKTLKKKKGYSHTANIFAKKHPKAYKWQINIFNRYIIYFKNIKYFFIHPILYIGMIYMKTCEFGAGGLGLIFTHYRR